MDGTGARRALGSLLAGVAALAFAGTIGGAQAAGSVVVYCGVNEGWCRAAVTAFEQKTGIHVDMTRQSAGEIYARLRAEKDSPRGDIWYGGTGDPHLQAAAEGLTEAYQSPALAKLQDWAQAQAKISGNRTVGLYLGVLGFGYNGNELTRPQADRARLLVRPGEARLQGRSADGGPQFVRHRLDHAGNHCPAHGRG